LKRIYKILSQVQATKSVWEMNLTIAAAMPF